MAQTSDISGSHFSSSKVFSIASATIRLCHFTVLIAEWTFCSCSACFNIQFFLHQYPSLLNSPSLSLKEWLGGPKYDIHIKNMLQIISSLFLVLISLAVEYLVDVSIVESNVSFVPFPLNPDIQCP